MVDYALEPESTADEFIDVLVRSGLAERRPVHDLPTIAKMPAGADTVSRGLQGLLPRPALQPPGKAR
jgi:hypothetical protein